MKGKNFIFTVQGEGRGHLTQAIALFDILKKNGHTISCVLLGTNDHRQVPDFFLKKINVPIYQLSSPHFVMDGHTKSIHLGKTFSKNITKIGIYSKSLAKIKEILNSHQPDIVLNFYEPLMGLYALRNKLPFKLVSISHQNIYLHEGFTFPPGDRIQATILKRYTSLTSFGSDLYLAISMYPLAQSKNKKIIVCPPILRNELFQLTPKVEDFILVYLLNSGYMKDIINWQKNNSHVNLVCFTDNREVKEKYKGEWRMNEKLVFHSLKDQKFLDFMSSCKGLVCTAGFEAVCEAMYLGKPAMMVPVAGHYEQYCNAVDASKFGAGFYSKEFNLTLFENYFTQHHQNNEDYKNWVDGMEKIILCALENKTEPSEDTQSNPTRFRFFNFKFR
jgi:uncharacterized protein (TIGR00661 family)